MGGPKQRALLALLVLQRGKAVSRDRLIDALWGETPPRAAKKTVQVYVSRLRKTLGDGLLQTRAGGYALALTPDQLDSDRFEQMLKEGRELLASGDPERASATLREALSLWRGAPLADLTYEAFAASEIRRLEDSRIAALEDRIKADLQLGREAELEPELEALVREHPLRERLRAQLMLALYRSGRQVEALTAYQELRRARVDELGLEPSPALQELEQAMLRQDPALALGRRGALAEVRRRISRRSIVVFALAGALLVAAVVMAVVFFTGSDAASAELAPVAENSIAMIDPKTNAVLGGIPVGTSPSSVVVGEDAV